MNGSSSDLAARMAARLQRRRAVDRTVHVLAKAGLGAALAFLVVMLATIVVQGCTAFVQTEILLPVTFDPAVIDPDGLGDPAILGRADYGILTRRAIESLFPDAVDRADRRELSRLISPGADLELRRMMLADPSLLRATRAVWLPVSAPVDQLVKGRGEGRAGGRELQRIDRLRADGRLASHFNKWLFSGGDSRQPELAGLWGAMVGSVYLLLVTLLLCFPLGVAAAVHLEEFAGKNRWNGLIEININNLAAVPSIVFGLVGLEIFLNTFGLARSTPLVGGLTLTLATLPTIIIAARGALKGVPQTVREAALGLGASRLQMVIHHVLPLALPGILTGTVVAMARAVGEAAPLLMIGMLAFVANVPAGPLDPATALPVQIFLWASNPELAFVERTSAAIMVLLFFLAAINAGALILRNRCERRW